MKVCSKCGIKENKANCGLFQIDNTLCLCDNCMEIVYTGEL